MKDETNNELHIFLMVVYGGNVCLLKKQTHLIVSTYVLYIHYQGVIFKFPAKTVRGRDCELRINSSVQLSCYAGEQPLQLLLAD